MHGAQREYFKHNKYKYIQVTHLSQVGSDWFSQGADLKRKH